MIVAFPALTGVTTPFALTLAIFLLLVFHPSFALDALAGVIFTANLCAFPTYIVFLYADHLIFDTFVAADTGIKLVIRNTPKIVITVNFFNPACIMFFVFLPVSLLILTLI